MHCSIVLSFTR